MTDRTERKNHSNAGAVVRIVIWLVVLCLLGGLFAVCLMGYLGGEESDGWFPQIFHLGFAGSYWYDDSDYSVGDHEFTERITSLDIDWMAGSVTIVPSEGDALTIQEQFSTEDTDTRDQLCWRVVDGKLTVKFCEPFRFLAFHMPAKSLTVTVPAAWLEDMTSVKVDTASASVRVNGLRADRLDVDTASGSVTLTDLTARDLDVDTASGSVTLTDLTVQELNVDTASGQVQVVNAMVDTADMESASGSITFGGNAGTVDVDTASGRVNLTLTERAGRISVSSVSGSISITGSADEVDLDTTSGTLTLTLTQAARKVSTDSVSGRLEMHLPASISGFTVNMDSVSGEITANGFATEGGNRHRVYGDGSMTIDYDTVSGNVIIFNDAESTN